MTPPASPSSSHPAREPFVPPPECHSGDFGTHSYLLLQYNPVFRQTAIHLSFRIAYILDLLRSKDGQWATALWEKQVSYFRVISYIYF